MTKARLRIETPDVARAINVLDNLGLVDVRLETGTEPAQIVSGEITDVAAEDANAALVAAGVRVRALSTDRGSLEESFVALTGEGFDVDG